MRSEKGEGRGERELVLLVTGTVIMLIMSTAETAEGAELKAVGSRRDSGASSMTFQNDLCALRVPCGEYVTARLGFSVKRA